MHRGKNRSRKPVEVTSTPPTTMTISSIITKTPSISSETHHHLNYQDWYTTHFPAQDNTTHLLFDSAFYSQTDTDYRNRYGYGLKEEDQHGFLAEASGTMRSFFTPSIDDSWNLTSSSKQRSDYSYLQLQSLTNKRCEREEEETQKIHHFIDEWPLKSRNSWLDLDDKSSNDASVSTTRLSISIPSSSDDFPHLQFQKP